MPRGSRSSDRVAGRHRPADFPESGLDRHRTGARSARWTVHWSGSQGRATVAEIRLGGGSTWSGRGARDVALAAGARVCRGDDGRGGELRRSRHLRGGRRDGGRRRRRPAGRLAEDARAFEDAERLAPTLTVGRSIERAGGRDRRKRRRTRSREPTDPQARASAATRPGNARSASRRAKGLRQIVFRETRRPAAGHSRLGVSADVLDSGDGSSAVAASNASPRSEAGAGRHHRRWTEKRGSGRPFGAAAASQTAQSSMRRAAAPADPGTANEPVPQLSKPRR